MARIQVTKQLAIDPAQVIAVQESPLYRGRILLYTGHWHWEVEVSELTKHARLLFYRKARPS